VDDGGDVTPADPQGLSWKRVTLGAWAAGNHERAGDQDLLKKVYAEDRSTAQVAGNGAVFRRDTTGVPRPTNAGTGQLLVPPSCERLGDQSRS